MTVFDTNANLPVWLAADPTVGYACTAEEGPAQQNIGCCLADIGALLRVMIMYRRSLRFVLSPAPVSTFISWAKECLQTLTNAEVNAYG